MVDWIVCCFSLGYVKENTLQLYM